MRFGVREICDVVLRAKAKQTLGSRTFYKNEPVLYFNTLKTSSLEGASTTVYAQGGRGNPRLIAWEGERTLTFTMEDALLSAESFAILSGAGLVAATEDAPIYVHTTDQVQATAPNVFTVEGKACWNRGRNGTGEFADNDYYHAEADIFCMKLDDNGEIASEPCVPATVSHDENGNTVIVCKAGGGVETGDIVFVDYYVKRTGKAQTIEITADKFGGNYYLEASTLFRREADGVDMPAEFVIPNCKIQSNFTFTMASSGDPSTFTFTIDAFPDYTKFDRTHKVLAAIQVIEDADENSDEIYRDMCGDTEHDDIPEPNKVEGVTKHADAKNVSVARVGNTISVSGFAKGDEYDKNLFDDDGSRKVKGVQVEIAIPDGFTNDVTITTTNPGLAYYEGDDNITHLGSTWTKEAKYATLPAGETLAVIVTDKKGTISTEFKSGDKTEKYTILNSVNFISE
ncbi:MAG: hypothetical protein NC218_07485 [Acetobacter sp.]|nr:hypothetical protein [Acetobacter sp.]